MTWPNTSRYSSAVITGAVTVWPSTLQKRFTSLRVSVASPTSFRSSRSRLMRQLHEDVFQRRLARVHVLDPRAGVAQGFQHFADRVLDAVELELDFATLLADDALAQRIRQEVLCIGPVELEPQEAERMAVQQFARALDDAHLAL